MKLQNAKTSYNVGHGRFRKIVLGLLILSAITLFVVPNAQSLTIIGNLLPGDPPSNAVGGGNLADVFKSAATMWEAVIFDSKTITLNYQWGPVYETGMFAKSDPLLYRTITFDNDGTTTFFIDPTPHLYEEYRDFFLRKEDWGGGFISTGVGLWNPSPDSPALNMDLVSLAAHEIGHFLGFSYSLDYLWETALDGDIDITAPRPFAGSHLPVVGAHLNLDWALIAPSPPNTGLRIYPSDADILAVGQLMGLSRLTMGALPVPEPTTMLLLASGLIGLAGYGRRKFFRK